MTLYTCTLNLAIDLFIETENLVPFTVNRTTDDDIQANGKGVNVSLILKMLGIDSIALGFQAGFTGKYIEDYLNEKEIRTNFIEVPGMTRINVFTQVNNSGEEYKLVNKGPSIPEESIVKFLNQIKKLESGDYLCVSGSLPKGVRPSIFEEISRICFENGVHLIIDSSYPEIINCLKYQPFLLKPNEEELSEWFGTSLVSRKEYLIYARKLIEEGAQNVLLSLGSEGAVFVNEKMLISGNSPKGEVVNTACAGDTLLATFLAGMLKKSDWNETLKHSIAAGSSTAFTKGLTDFSNVEELKKQIKVINEGVH